MKKISRWKWRETELILKLTQAEHHDGLAENHRAVRRQLRKRQRHPEEGKRYTTVKTSK